MAGKYDLKIDQGATFPLTVTCLDGSSAPIDLTTWSFVGRIKKTYSDAAALATLTIATNVPATDGILNISMTAAQTAALPVNNAQGANLTPTRYCYEVEATMPDGSIYRLLEGLVLVSPRV